jgi:pyruvate/2-oxoglutarate dehydrogenase complex dihydrolipoamide dehydrogenase (E3) component
MTKSEAEKQGFEVLIHIPMTKIARAKEKGETKGFMEAIIDAKQISFRSLCFRSWW